jgi:hypothetical protein
MRVGQSDSAKRDFASRLRAGIPTCTLRQADRNDRVPERGRGRAGTAVRVVAIQALEGYLRS